MKQSLNHLLPYLEVLFSIACTSLWPSVPFKKKNMIQTGVSRQVTQEKKHCNEGMPFWTHRHWLFSYSWWTSTTFWTQGCSFCDGIQCLPKTCLPFSPIMHFLLRKPQVELIFSFKSSNGSAVFSFPCILNYPISFLKLWLHNCLRSSCSCSAFFASILVMFCKWKETAASQARWLCFSSSH